MASDFTSFLYLILALPTVKGIVFGGLLAAVVLPSLFELFNWRRG